MVTKLLPLIPSHRIYVEPFGGGASLLFAKEPSLVEVYNDIDSGLVNFFRVLRDPIKFDRLLKLASLTPYSREEYEYCRDTWNACEDDVERAYRWYVVVRMSFNGNHSWSYNVTASSRGMAEATSRWLSAIDRLPAVHERIMRVQIEHDDFRRILERYDTPETFFYLDPPYIPETRRGGKYKHELTEDDHRDLVSLLLNLQGMAMLSGYAHEIYTPLEEAGWKRIDFETTCHAAGRTRQTGILGKGAAMRKQKRVESVWLCPKTVASLEEVDANIWQKKQA